MHGASAGQRAVDDEFARFVRSMRPELRRRAFLLCGDWYSADDLVQEVLIKIYRTWDSLADRERLSSYTRTVMYRTFISERRTHRWSRELIEDDVPESITEYDVSGHLGDRLLLLSALAQLGPRQRAVVTLRYWEDLSVSQTAETLGCSLATVRSQAARALTRLRSILQPEVSAAAPMAYSMQLSGSERD